MSSPVHLHTTWDRDLARWARQRAWARRITLAVMAAALVVMGYCVTGCRPGADALKEPELTPAAFAILDTGEIVEINHEAPQPSCTAGSCELSLNETCRVYAPVPTTGLGPYYIGQCQTNTVQVKNKQCSCTCMGFTGVTVVLSCSDRWLVNRT